MNRTDQRGLRVVYVGTLPPHQGGSAIMAFQLLAGLAARAHQIEAIAPISEAAAQAGAGLAPPGATISVSRFTMPYMDVSPDAPAPECYRERERAEIESLLAASFARRRPDVVIIGRESFAPHVVEVARTAAVPTVLLFQGATTQGILNGSYPAAAAEGLLEHFRGADVAVTSARHMQIALTRLGIPGVEVIPNPVDLAHFTAAAPSHAVHREFGAADDGPVVAHVSNLKPIKRPLDFVHAAAIAAREDRRLVFAVVGDGPGGAELRRACAELGIAERFRFTGWIDHAGMAGVLNSADIVAMPSAGEAQALAYLETQACERTLIASEIPAAREVVVDGETGLLHPVGDVEALAKQILVASRDSDLRRRLGRQARAGLAKHSLPQVVGRYEELLRRLADRERGGEAVSGCA